MLFSFLLSNLTLSPSFLSSSLPRFLDYKLSRSLACSLASSFPPSPFLSKPLLPSLPLSPSLPRSQTALTLSLTLRAAADSAESCVAGRRCWQRRAALWVPRQCCRTRRTARRTATGRAAGRAASSAAGQGGQHCWQRCTQRQAAPRWFALRAALEVVRRVAAGRAAGSAAGREGQRCKPRRAACELLYKLRGRLKSRYSKHNTHMHTNTHKNRRTH